MKEEQFKLLWQKLHNITKLLALNYVKDIELQKDKILILSTFGFTPMEIASVLGTSSNTVSVALSRAKKSEQISA